MKKSIVFWLSPLSIKPTLSRKYESYDKQHRRLGNKMQHLVRSAVSSELTHPLSQLRPPTTDCGASLQRVMGCKRVNPTSPCLSLITTLDSCRLLYFFDSLRRGAVRLGLSAGPPALHSTNSAQFLSLLLTAALSQFLAQQHCDGLEAELSADIVPTADYWGRLVDTGPLLQCCCTDSSCLCLIVLPAARSCVSSHELPCWMGQADGIHNNILFEEVFICRGSLSSWSLQEKAWYQSPNTDEARVGDYTRQP